MGPPCCAGAARVNAQPRSASTFPIAPAIRRGSVSLPWRSLLLAAAAILAYLAFGNAPVDWVFDRAAIAGGEWWRLITGHWVHCDPAHVGWDVAALLVFGALFEERLKWRLPLALLVASLGVDAWLWWGLPSLAQYCGLSGILNGVLILGLVSLWRETRHPLVWLTGAAAAMKIVLEIHLGQALLTETAWPSVPTAHAAGFLCGLALASVTLRT
jgi:rhomboid family GlyGly-CTERM serine protease